MASVLETTAVSLRKGNHAANLVFTGISGELVADLGNGTESAQGTDHHATLRLHNGVTQGGIEMARADMRNVTTAVLAEFREAFADRNLAYSDLRNLQSLVGDANQQLLINNVVNTFQSYGIMNEAWLTKILEGNESGYEPGYVLRNTYNFNTKYLAGDIASAIHTGVDGNKPLAYQDTSNIDTYSLTDPSLHPTTGQNRPLAYADMRNVDTANLATNSGISHQGKDLAYTDITNVTKTTLVNKGLQDSSNRFTDTIDVDGTYTTDQYPSLLSAKDYIDTQDSKRADVHLSNLTGMDSADTAVAEATNWKINKNDVIPDLNSSTSNVDAVDAEIATFKQVWKFVQEAMGSLSGASFRPMTTVTTNTIYLQPFVANYHVKPGVALTGAMIFDTSNIASVINVAYYKYGTVYLDTEKPVVGNKLYDSNFDIIEGKWIETVVESETQPYSFKDNDGVLYTSSQQSVTNPENIASFKLSIHPEADLSGVTWPSNVTWLDGSVPPLPTGSNYSIEFTSYDGLATWQAIAEGWSTARWD